MSLILIVSENEQARALLALINCGSNSSDGDSLWRETHIPQDKASGDALPGDTDGCLLHPAVCRCHLGMPTGCEPAWGAYWRRTCKLCKNAWMPMMYHELPPKRGLKSCHHCKTAEAPMTYHELPPKRGLRSCHRSVSEGAATTVRPQKRP